LKKCFHVLEERIEPQALKIRSDLVYEEQPVQILDSKDRVTQNRKVKMYKVLWSHHDERDATWEIEDYLSKVYKDFHKRWLVTQISGRDFIRGKGCNTPGVKLAFALAFHEHNHHLMSISIICIAFK
jgi:hypothetical protein